MLTNLWGFFEHEALWIWLTQVETQKKQNKRQAVALTDALWFYTIGHDQAGWEVSWDSSVSMQASIGNNWTALQIQANNNNENSMVKPADESVNNALFGSLRWHSLKIYARRQNINCRGSNG